jgi:hypothetical protein
MAKISAIIPQHVNLVQNTFASAPILYDKIKQPERVW